MKQKGRKRMETKAAKELAEIIRKAQEQPGIADLLSLMEQSQELEKLAREHREAAVVSIVVSATATA